MAQLIQLKRSAVAGRVPTTANLALGELAINVRDGKLYFQRDDSTIQTILTTNSTVTGDIDLVGTVTATAFVGDGSGLTGIAVSPTLQEVTDNGASTTNGITVASLTTAGPVEGSLFRDADDNNYFVNPSGATSAVLSGNVGIGVGSPAAKLEVSGDILISGGSNQISFYGSSQTGYRLYRNSTTMVLRSDGNIKEDAGSNYTVSTNSTERLRINSTGNVGIGTTSPGTKLHVKGGASGYLFRVQGTNTFNVYDPGTTEIGVGSGSGQVFKLYSNDALNNGITIATNGSVGIGTTAPAGKLHVVGNILVQSGRVYTDELQGYSANQITLGDGASTLNLISRNSQNLAITGGNVGVGTTTPGSPLEVYGSGSTVLDIQGSQGQLFSVSDSLTGSLMSVNDISGLPILEVFDNDKVVMGEYGNNTLVVSGSKVGIGTDAPNDELHVQGRIRVTSDTATVPDVTLTDINNAYQAGLNSTGHLALRASSTMYFYTGGTVNRMTLSSTGNLGIGTTGPARRLDISAPSNDGIRIASGNAFIGAGATGGDTQLFYWNGATVYFGRGSLGGTIDSYEFRTGGTTRLTLQQTGQVTVNEYGSGTFTGTPAYALAVDANGNIIENAVQSTPTGGSGTVNYVPIWTASDTLGSSRIGQDSNGYKIYGNTGSAYTRLQLLSPSTGTLSLFEITHGSDDNNASAVIFGRGDSSYATIDSLSRGTGSTQAINFAIDSSEKMRLDTSGRLLINATSTAFSDKLYVNGDAYTTGSWRVGSGTTYVGRLVNGSGALTLESDGNRDIKFGSNTNGTQMYVDTSSGNVGIGTTSPNYRLAVYNNSLTDSFPIVAGSGVSAGEFVGIGLSGFVASNGAVKAGMVLDRVGNYGTGDIHFLNNSTEDNTDATLSDSKLVIKESGNVGIGTTSPGQKLTVNGSLGVTTGGVLYANDIAAYTGAMTVGPTGTVELKFRTSSQERMRIDSSGNVGINVTNPTEKLTVNGKTKFYEYGGAHLTNQASSTYRFESLVTDSAATAGSSVGSYIKLTASATSSTGRFSDFRSRAYAENTVNNTDWLINYYAEYRNYTSTNAVNLSHHAGLYVTSLGIGGSATVSNNYGAYLDVGTNATNNYGIYQVGAGVKNHFAGSVGIGTTSPSSALDIAGVFQFDTSTDLLQINNNTNTGGINLSGNNSRIYFGGNRAIEGAQDGSNLFLGEGYSNVQVHSNAAFVVNGNQTLGGNLTVSGRTDLQRDLRLRGTDTNPSLGVVRMYVDANDTLFIDAANDGNNKIEISATGDLIVPGTITAQEFRAEFITNTIILESGSTQFGDSADDTHTFTGKAYFSENVGIGTNSPVPKLQLVYDGGTYSTDATSGFINQANTGRATLRQRSIEDAPAEIFFDVNGAARWDISVRDSGNDYEMMFFPQAATPAYNSVGNHVLALKQDGTVRLNQYGAGVLVTDANGNISADNLNFPTQANNDARYVNVTGDTMTGNLVLNKNTTIGGTNPSNGNLQITDGSFTLGIDSNEIHSTNAMYIGTNSGNLILRPAGDTTITNGKLGVGTATPGYLVEATGTIRATSSSPATGVGGAGLEVRYNTTDQAGSLLSYDRGNSVYKELRLEGSIIAIREAGSEVARFDGGNLGIGTTTPTSLLHLNKPDSSGAGIDFTNSDATSGLFIGVDSAEVASFWYRENKDMKFATNATERIRISADGKVGIGKNGMTYSLELGKGDSGNNVVMGYYDTAGTRQGFVGVIGTAGDFVDAGAEGDFFVRAQQKLHLSAGTTGNYQATMDTAGNFGIGTASPSDKLTVQDGTITSTDASGINYAKIDRFSGVTLAGNGTGSRGVQTPNTDALTFGTNATERMRITPLGLVGIGTTNPELGLHILGDASVAGIVVQRTGGQWLRMSAGTVGTALRFQNTGSFSFGPASSIGDTSVANAFYIDGATSDIGIGTTSPSYKLDVNGAVNSSVEFRAPSGKFDQIKNRGTGNTVIDFNGSDFVGIGTTSPSQKLTVNGNIRATGSTARLTLDNTSGQAFQIYAWGSGTNIYNSATSNADIWFGRDAVVANNFYFTRNGTNHTMKVDTANERVGIGTMSPTEKLHVAGNVAIEGTAKVVQTANEVTGDPAGTRMEIFSSAYIGAFIDYTIFDSGKNHMRSGTIQMVFDGNGGAQFTDNSTLDIGDTSPAYFDVVATPPNTEIKFFAPDPDWSVRYHVRYL